MAGQRKTPPSTLDKLPPSDAFDAMVRVTVGKGKEKRSFQVYRGLTSFYSGYFDRAFNGQFTEAAEKEVTLATEDPKIFELFQYWLYTKRFLPVSPAEEVKQLDWGIICKLWIFGDAHEVPLLQNMANDILLKNVVDVWLVPAHQLKLIYAKTTPTAKLRLLVIELLSCTGGDNLLANGSATFFPEDALVDIFRLVWRANAKRWTQSDVRNLDLCQWHVHEEGAKCLRALVKEE